MPKSRSFQLVAVMNERRLVRIARRFEDSTICGYVLAVGPKFFLLALVSDRLWFDGFECFRVSDVLSVSPNPYRVFIEAALKKRGQRRPRKPKIDLKDIESLLLTANRAFPLTTIHQEKVDPDVCHIGRVLEIARGRVTLHAITPHATWDDQPTKLRLSDNTRVNFGGDYEDALHIVAGDAAG